MMKLFALVLLFNGETYVIDHDQTREDCARRIEEGVSMLDLEDGRVLIVPETASYMCEPQ